MSEDYYAQLLARADGFSARVHARHPRSMACREGCSLCCRRHFSLFPVEAHRVALAVAALPAVERGILAERLLGDPEPAACPLLVDDRCSIYQDRPLICRTHGLPLLIRDEEGERTDVCPLNFADDPGPIPASSVLDLDRLNEILVAINVHDSRRQGRDPGARSSMARITASALGLPSEEDPGEVEEDS